MTKLKTKPVEIVLATWPDVNHARFLGDGMASRMVTDTCTSFWLNLRAVDDDSYAAWQVRNVISDIGLWVWLSAGDKGVSYFVEPRLHNVYSATMRETEDRLRMLKRLCSAMPEQDSMPFASYIALVLERLRIKRSMQYHGIGNPETFHPVGEVVARITALYDDLAAQCLRLRKEAA